MSAKARPERISELSPKNLFPALMGNAVWAVRHSGWRMILLYLGFQGLTALIALPVIRWLFREVLSAAGLHGVDMNTLGTIFTVPLSLALLLALIVLALMVVSLQLTVLLLACARMRTYGTFTLAELVGDARRLLRKLSGPGSLALLLYLFVILPLSQFGFLSALTRTMAIPDFITGELLKSASGTTAYVIFLLALFVLNVRLCLVLPVFALTDASGFAAYRLSWRLTRQAFFTLIAAIVIVFVAANIVGFALIAVATLPTVLTDAVAPDLSPVAAAVGLGISEVVGLLVVGITVAVLCAMLLELFRRGQVLAPTMVVATPIPLASGDGVAAVGAPRMGGGWRGPLVVATAMVCAVAGLAAVNIPAMESLQQTPGTLVLAHRGFSAGGVENTIPGLEAAAEAGADMVEMDVMETSDGEFVAMHDANLQRLAGRNVTVGQLTLAEITALEVSDGQGHTAAVPSFRDYLGRAKELRMPLLVEIKLHGGEGPNLVPRLVAEMESMDAFTNNIFHSLDKPSIEELKQLRPSAYTGYTMAFAGVAVPETTADFVVVEEWSYSTSLRDDAWRHGKEIYVWTVNSESGLRQKLRDDVDALITDRPDMALNARSGMSSERGLAGILRDAITRFVTVL
ncbi:glycerophosphoryl diester phosphodiesterase membrane domain-containing protein [Arthrobacter sp. GMC3]|uniref:glycerophosphoryl diester phosphodiesterase membrane domain-containing protein n=1 Tax=Arthrobacter sp. GMC3 TaxID=2058894 RepID=UPI000CE4DAD3|nr:glycerophosphoryl diester phosphodiesterase membrane domain-containing protein [Arthrobacter sp. GMC3]